MILSAGGEMRRIGRLAFAAALVPLAGLPAGAQSSAGLIAPSEVIIYVPPSLKSRAFLTPLVCALKRVLIARVETAALDLSFTAEMRATTTQLDVAKVANRFLAITTTPGASTSFKYLLLPYDLKAQGLNYVFATSFGNQTTAYHVGIISTARLDVSNSPREHRDAAAITAQRVYKLMMKSIARLAGLKAPDRCVLMFPRSLDELDQKSDKFCPADHETLVTAKILKPEEEDTGDCLVVAERKPHRSLLSLR